MKPICIPVFFLSFLFSFSGLAADNAKVMGAGSCSASSCHGGTGEEDGQFTRWSIQDKHSKAYDVLFSKKSVKMAKILGLKAPHEDEFCLKCHATLVSGDERGPKFDWHDGVGCESCHGAAQKWLEPHTREGQTHAQNVALGLVDNNKLSTRAETCIACHTGLSHREYGAGHPELTFELDTFSALMPRHWKSTQRWEGAQSWFLGQAALLEKGLVHVAEKTKKEGRVDEADMTCVTCHHNLFDVDYDLPETSHGLPAWQSGHADVILPFLEVVMPQPTDKLKESLDKLKALFEAQKGDAEKISSQASHALAILKNMQVHFTDIAWNASLVQRGMTQVVARRLDDPNLRFRTAEQTTMALDALSLSMSEITKKAPILKAEIKKMYEVLNVTDPARFARTPYNQVLSSVAAKLKAQPLPQADPVDATEPQEISEKTQSKPAFFDRIRQWFKK